MASAFDPEHIAVSKSKGIKIDWKDGHRSEYSCAWLRDHCPCATCTGAHGNAPQKTSYSSPQSSPFPIYRPAIRILDVEPAGHYAIRILWNDGHNTGIYSYEHLRRICPCAECIAMKEKEPA